MFHRIFLNDVHTHRDHLFATPGAVMVKRDITVPCAHPTNHSTRSFVIITPMAAIALVALHYSFPSTPRSHRPNTESCIKAL